jgi:dolichol kinase
MNKITREFVSNEKREFKFKLGQVLASSLAGFIGGFLVATIIWVVIYSYVVPAA